MPSALLAVILDSAMWHGAGTAPALVDQVRRILALQPSPTPKHHKNRKHPREKGICFAHVLKTIRTIQRGF